MISVPNSQIVIRAQNNASFVETRPAWFADMFKAVWGNRLDPEHGVSVEPVPDTTPPDMRYSTFGGYDTAERETITFFTSGDPKKFGAMATLFNKVFPDGLRATVERMIIEDAARAKEEAAKNRSAPKPHDSFLEAGVLPLAALNIQRKGWATVADVPADSILALVGCGMNPAQASALLDLADKVRAPKKPAPVRALETVGSPSKL